MNNITIAGNITRDIEIRTVGADSVGSFSVADNQGKDKPAIFWNCQIWGKRSGSLAPYLLKGQTVTVSGTISEREYTNRDGVKVKTMELRVNDVALQGGKREASSEGYQGGTGQRDTKPARKPAPDADPFAVDDSDIPF